MYKKTQPTTIAKKDYSFTIAYSRLDKSGKSRVRKEICEKLNIAEQTFKVKKLAYSNITAVEADIIREAFAKEEIKKVFNYEYVD